MRDKRDGDCVSMFELDVSNHTEYTPEVKMIVNLVIRAVDDARNHLDFLAGKEMSGYREKNGQSFLDALPWLQDEWTPDEEWTFAWCCTQISETPELLFAKIRGRLASPTLNKIMRRRVV